MRSRPAVRCRECNSLERTRVLMLQLERHNMPLPGQRVLHFAPEIAVTRKLTGIVGSENYFARDLQPKNFAGIDVKPFDLCKESPNLETEHYDLIIHSHVMEHLPCNYTAVLWHLHRSLRSTGLHVCSIPIVAGGFEDNWGPISAAERTRRFGQHDHLRRFGVDDLASTLGMVFELPATYNLEAEFSPELLDRYNIPAYARVGFTQHSVLVLRKKDLKLQ